MTNNTNLPCDIVQDLLPSYVDGILSDTSALAVARHLQTCKSCHRMYDDMTTDTPQEITKEREIDYLKKIRAKTRHFAIATVLIAVLLAGSGTAIYLLFFGGEYILNNAKYHLQVSSNSMNLEWILPDDFTTTANKIEENDGIISLTLPAKKNTIFSRHKNYKVSYTAKATIREVRVNGDIIWANGSYIKSYTNTLYQEKHPYIGSAPDNESLALALGIENQFGSFTSELQTEKEPYNWTLRLSQSQTLSESALQEKMTMYSYAILALVNNVDSVTWEYQDSAKQSHTYAVTTSDANRYLAGDIKSVADNISDFQNFINKLGLK